MKGVDTLAQAKECVGKECLLPEEDFSHLDRESYYLFQIVGCSVVTVNGNEVGTVKDLLLIKDNDILEVMRKGKEILIPFTEKICVEVNLKKKEIVIDPPEGLLEINEI
jgi:16S rRNA processing protein RimM